MGLIKKPSAKGGSTTKKSAPAAKKVGVKRTTTKSNAPAKKTAAKSTATKTTKKTSAAKQEPTRRRGTAHLDPKVLARWEKELAAAGKRLSEAQAEHNAASTLVHDVAAQAREHDVPMSIVTDLLGVSRQYLYKGVAGNGRKNGTGPKVAAKKAAGSAKKSAGKTTTKSSPKATTAKKGSGKKTLLKKR